MSDIHVVRLPKPNGAAASQIATYLGARPHEHTVAEIAAAVEIPEAQVVEILNTYRANGDGTVTRVPDGQGGGWLPEEIGRLYYSDAEGDVSALLDLD